MNDVLILTMQHIYMVVISVSIACLISIPTAIYIYNKNFYVNHILNVVSLMQSIPSLAVYAILVPFVGIGMKLAVITLVMYCILPIFLNTIIGFNSLTIDENELMNTLNLDKKTRLFQIQLPIAMPYIISGIRLTTIYAISLTTIATLVGAGGLGDLIYLGLQQLDLKLTFMGVIPLLILTLITNYLFNKLEYRLTPIHKRNGVHND